VIPAHGIGTAAAQRGCFCNRCTVPPYYAASRMPGAVPEALFLKEDDAITYARAKLGDVGWWVAKVAITITAEGAASGMLTDGERGTGEGG
jgi:hypothetical protein